MSIVHETACIPLKVHMGQNCIWTMKNIIVVFHVYKSANVLLSVRFKSKSRPFGTISYSPDMKLGVVVIVAVYHTHHTALLTFLTLFLCLYCYAWFRYVTIEACYFQLSLKKISTVLLVYMIRVTHLQWKINGEFVDGKQRHLWNFGIVKTVTRMLLVLAFCLNLDCSCAHVFISVEDCGQALTVSMQKCDTDLLNICKAKLTNESKWRGARNYGICDCATFGNVVPKYWWIL